MNISVYLFGEFSSGYSQYPIDYTSSIFQDFRHNSKANTQIAIHRDRDLMYYAYLRKMENGKDFGICCVLNGMMLTQVDGLFKLFETAMSMQIARGTYVRFADDGTITTGDSATASKEEYNLLADYLRNQLEKIQTTSLPPVSYSNANTSVKDFTIDDPNNDIVKSSSVYSYTYIYKSKGYDTAQTNSYKGIIAKQKRPNVELQKRCGDLSVKLAKEKVKQRNMKWVGFLGAIVFVFGIILWNKVLFPSEVTRYETGEFVYYGPLNSNHEPNGIGVAIYPSNDPQKRKFYIGNFTNGKRQDKEAMLLYQNGDYYYGSMDEDKWKNGILYMKTDNSHFTGDFNENKPYNGMWYDHKAVLQVNDGIESCKITKHTNQTQTATSKRTSIK